MCELLMKWSCCGCWVVVLWVSNGWVVGVGMICVICSDENLFLFCVCVFVCVVLFVGCWRVYGVSGEFGDYEFVDG